MQPKSENCIENCVETEVHMQTPCDFEHELQERRQRQVPEVLAELFCNDEVLEDENENEDEGVDVDVSVDSNGNVHSYFDKVLLHHPQGMERMKFLEQSAQPNYDYFNGGSEILPYMRKVVASWMLEVCEEQECDEAVFPLSCGILDKLLSLCCVKKEQLQLVACVCLLLSSKTRQSSHFSLELLSFYTNHSVSENVMRSWEMMILSILNWDVNVITPIDFVDILLVQCMGIGSHGRKDTQLLRRHAITFIALASTEPRFVNLSPSLLCGSAIHTALRGMNRDTPEIIQRLAHHSAKSLEQLNTITGAIENVVATEMAAIQQTAPPQLVVMNKTPSLIHGQKLGGANEGGEGLTPTDVQGIIV